MNIMNNNWILKTQKSLRAIPEKNTWRGGGVGGGRQKGIYFSMGVWVECFKLYVLLVFDRI